MTEYGIPIMIYGWVSEDIGAYTILFNTQQGVLPNPTGYLALTNVSGQDKARSSIITLSNGVNYDYNQTYDAPIVPGTVSVESVFVRGSSTTNSQVEHHYTQAVGGLGRRGILLGVAEDYNFVYVKALSRLIQVDKEMIGPKYDTFHNRGLDHGGIKVSCLFELISKFEINTSS